MAKVIITLKIMPESTETDLAKVEEKARQEITKYGGEIGKVEQVPVAFGLKSLNIVFVSDESKGSTEDLEKGINMMDEVSSVQVTDVRRAIG